MYIAVTLVVVLSLSWLCTGNAQPCDIGPEIRNFGLRYYESNSRVRVMPRHAIYCTGVVSKWTFMAKHTGKFRAMIFRRVSGGNSNEWTVIGVNDISVSEDDVNRKSVHLVPENELIPVDTGDVIGIAVGTDNPKIQSYDTHEYRASQYAMIADPSSLTAGNVIDTEGDQWEDSIAVTISDPDVIEVNECDSFPCQNGGSCEDGVDVYTCHCTAGHTGIHCEQCVDSCASSPCIHGQCRDGSNDFKCECDESWTGKQCNVFQTKACTTGDHVLNRQSYLLGGYVDVFTRHPVSCNGNVTSWDFWAGSAATFRVIVFRHAGGDDSNQFVIVGINDIPTSSIRANQMSTYVVPYDQQIQAEIGDFLGVAIHGQRRNPLLQIDSGNTYATRVTSMDDVTHLARGDNISMSGIATLHVSLSAIVSNAGCFIIDTPNEYTYQFAWPRIRTGVKSFVFGVRAESDAHIALSPIDAVADPMYEIVLGVEQNSKSLIRLCKSCTDEVALPTPGILSNTEYREFLVSFKNNTLEVTRVGIGPFMSFCNPISFNVSYIGIATAWGSEGSWWFCGFDFTPPEPTTTTTEATDITDETSKTTEATDETSTTTEATYETTTTTETTDETADLNDTLALKEASSPQLLIVVILLATVVFILVAILISIACFCNISCNSPLNQPSSQISHIALTPKGQANPDI